MISKHNIVSFSWYKRAVSHNSSSLCTLDWTGFSLSHGTVWPKFKHSEIHVKGQFPTIMFHHPLPPSNYYDRVVCHKLCCIIPTGYDKGSYSSVIPNFWITIFLVTLPTHPAASSCMLTLKIDAAHSSKTLISTSSTQFEIMTLLTSGITTDFTYKWLPLQ